MPANPSSPPIRPEDILSDHSPEVRTLAHRLRQLIGETIPEAGETAYPSWHGIGYRHPQVGYFCAIFPQVNHVRLGFEFGVLLPDPAGLLEGSGKQVRYASIWDEDSIPVAAIQELLRAATSLPADHKTRLWLVQNAAKPGE